VTTRFAIAYISPNGATGQVAAAIADELGNTGAAATIADLSNASETRSLRRALQSDDETVLVVGSPVYANVAVPPVMAFIDELPQSPGRWAVPFATYGIACSGIALWQMARALTGKGCRIAGAAKIAALHSMMWRSEQPEGEGRPDADDLSQARLLARTLHARLSSGTTSPLELSALDYQPPELAARFKQQLDHPWSGIARTVDDDLCDECGECAQSCPVDAITLDPTPVFGEACFHCCNCIRLCPNEAIVPEIALSDLETMIRTRVRSIDEQPRSQIFLAGEPGGH